MVTGGRIEILLVEDNLGDVCMVREALKEGRLHEHLSVVEDGEAALNFLRRKGPYRDAPRPDLIVLDLNLPKKDGRTVLAEIKADSVVRDIPVVVFTSLAADEDINKSYRQHADLFRVKPLDVDEFFAAVRSIEDFYLSVTRRES